MEVHSPWLSSLVTTSWLTVPKWVWDLILLSKRRISDVCRGWQLGHCGIWILFYLRVIWCQKTILGKCSYLYVNIFIVKLYNLVADHCIYVERYEVRPYRICDVLWLWSLHLVLSHLKRHHLRARSCSYHSNWHGTMLYLDATSLCSLHYGCVMMRIGSLEDSKKPKFKSVVNMIAIPMVVS